MNTNGTEAIYYRRKINYTQYSLRLASVWSRIAKCGEENRNNKSCAYTYYKRNHFSCFLTFNRCKHNHKESKESNYNSKNIIFCARICRVMHCPNTSRTCKRKSDNGKDRSDNYGRQQFIYPFGAYKLYNQADNYVYQRGKHNTYYKSPVAVIVRCDRAERAEEGKRATEKDRASELCK